MSDANYWEHPDWWGESESDDTPVAFVAERSAGDVVRDTVTLFRTHGIELSLGLVVLVAPLALLNAVVSIAAGAPHLTTAALTNVALAGLVEFAAWDDGSGLRWLAQHVLSLMALGVASAGAFAYLSLYTQEQDGSITPDVLWHEARPLFGAMGQGYTTIAGVIVVLWLLAQIPIVGGLLWVGGLTVLVAVGGLTLVALAYEADSVTTALRRVADLLAADLTRRLRPSLGIVVAAAGAALAVQPIAFVLGVVARMGASVGGVFGGTVLVGVEVLGLLLVPLLALPTVAATLAYGHLLALDQGPPPNVGGNRTPPSTLQDLPEPEVRLAVTPDAAVTNEAASP